MIHPILALHGFLGKPSDWDLIGLEEVQGIELDAFSLKSLNDWGKTFNCFLQKEEQIFHYHRKPILMGYSLGGRLALHTLIQNPSLYHAGIIISAHPGLSNPSEKNKRYREDLFWAKRFLNEDWDTLLSSWNQRQTFSNALFHFERKEKDYERQTVSDMLTNFSLGKQEDLREALRYLPIPLLWVVGEQDKIYKELGSSLQFQHPDSKVITIPHAAHRVPWEQPDAFKKALQSWCQNEISSLHKG